MMHLLIFLGKNLNLYVMALVEIRGIKSWFRRRVWDWYTDIII